MYDYWRCDECRRLFPADIPQHPVRIQQQTERIYGTEQVHRPVEALVFCPICFEKIKSPAEQVKWRRP